MAFSLFSQKHSSQSAGAASFGTPVVRTLRDDLQSIQKGEKNTSQAPSVAEKERRVPSAFFEKETSALAVNPFSEEGGQLLQSSAKQSENQPVAPFGIMPPSPNQPLPSFARPALENGLTPVGPSGELLSNHLTSSRKSLFIGIGLGGVALLIIVSGIGYFLFGRQETSPEESLTLPLAEKNLATPDNLMPQAPPFSKDLPNYLSLNTEIVSPEDIRQILAQIAGRIQTANMKEPIEFLITDQNNNPLAFSRFAFLLKLDVDPELLALINESFSLYVYNDAGQPRLGLVLTFRNTEAAALVIAKQEATLPYAFRALILEPNTHVARTLTFRSTTYNQFPIRFTNIDSGQNISLDYTLSGNQFFLGTSQYTLRAILDESTR